MLPEAYANLEQALAAYKQIADSIQAGDRGLRQLPDRNYLGLINEDESIEFTDGALRLIDAEGQISSKTASRRSDLPK